MINDQFVTDLTFPPLLRILYLFCFIHNLVKCSCSLLVCAAGNRSRDLLHRGIRETFLFGSNIDIVKAVFLLFKAIEWKWLIATIIIPSTFKYVINAHGIFHL